MTGAEFDTRTRLLGLSQAEIGAVCARDGRPVGDRQVRRWCAGQAPVPGDAADAVERLEDAMTLMVDQLVETVTKRSMAGPVKLRRYREQAELDNSVDGEQLPLGAHAIWTGWAADALAAEGIEVEIVWADEVD